MASANRQKNPFSVLRSSLLYGLLTGSSSCPCRESPRFQKARSAGPNFGLTPAQEQSGETDAPRRISKAGSSLVRHLLMTAANYILRESSPDTALKRHGLRICARGGKVVRRKAKVAVARKLAVTMLAMLKTGRPYEDKEAGKPPAVKTAESRRAS